MLAFDGDTPPAPAEVPSSLDLTTPGRRIGGVFSAALVSALVLAVPHGWHTVKVNPKLRAACDPVTLMVVGSARPTLGRDGWRAPARGQVLVFVEVDHVNKPHGPMRRPHHFHVPWSHLQPLEGCCGTPGTRGTTFWFREHGHLLGYIVFAGRGTSAATRRATERMLDSLTLV